MIKPRKVQPAIITYDQDNVKIAWIMPYNGGLGIPITSYDILIKKKDGSMIRYLPNCDGNSTTVVSNRHCIIPMKIFTGTTFGLV
jgi:hypothetical protein